MLCVAAAVLLGPGSACGTVAFDFEGTVFYAPGEIVKDHALVRVDGTFHLYYMTTSERSFGYATSADLRHRTAHGNILSARPGAWDGQAIWAPSITYYPRGAGYFLMFYTGVNSAFAQRTCLAMSHVPFRWNKAPDVLFTPFHGDTLWMPCEAINHRRWTCGRGARLNPVAEISVRSAPSAILTVSVYDVAGRSLRDLGARTDARGEAIVR